MRVRGASCFTALLCAYGIESDRVTPVHWRVLFIVDGQWNPGVGASDRAARR